VVSYFECGPGTLTLRATARPDWRALCAQRAR